MVIRWFGCERISSNERIFKTNEPSWFLSLVRLVRSQIRLLPDPLFADSSFTHCVSGEEGPTERRHDSREPANRMLF